MASNVFDRRRVNGPEESHRITFNSEQITELTNWKPDQPRPGRLPDDIRPIFIHPGLISQANGSAYIEIARTKIACAVYGPRQSKNMVYHETGRLNVEVKFAPFSCLKRRPLMRDAEDRSIGMAINQALLSAVRMELLPKSTIDVYLTVLENDSTEATIASGIITASAALADAGIEMLGLVTACCGAFVGQEVWMDPTQEESQLAQGSLVYACVPALDLVTGIWQSGCVDPQQLFACMKSCQDRCKIIHSVVSQTLLVRAQNS